MTGIALTCRRCGDAIPIVEPYHRGTGGLRCPCGAWLIDPDVTYCLGAHGAGISVGGCKSCGPDTREPDLQPGGVVLRDVTFGMPDNPCGQCGKQAGPYYCPHCGAT